MTLTSTTFSAAVSATSLYVPLASLTNVHIGDLLVCGREALLVTGLDALGVRVTRGQGSTPAEAHPSGATVYVGTFAQFYMRDPIGTPPDPVLVTPWINLRTGDVWTVVAGAWTRTTPSPLVVDGTQNTAIDASDAAIATLEGASDGLGSLRVARATFDPSTTAGLRTTGAHGLGVTLPDNAIVVGGFVQVVTTFESAADSATVALKVQGANDVVSAIAIDDAGDPWDAGLHAIIPKANTPESTGILLSAEREITATVAVQALTAGKAIVFLYYVQGD